MRRGFFSNGPLTTVLLAAILAAGLGPAGSSGRHAARAGGTPPGPASGARHPAPASLALLDESLEPLIADFNAQTSRARFLAVLSPRCPACVHGALAIRQALMADTAASSPIYIVWTPMVAGDDHAAALQASSVLRSPRVRQYYDPENAVGAMLRRDVFAKAVAEMQSSVSPDHFIFDALWHRSADDPEWDIYMFFDPGIRWEDAAPRPSRWVRQIARFAEPGGDLMSLMWVNAYSDPPVEGDLAAQISALSVADGLRGHQ